MFLKKKCTHTSHFARHGQTNGGKFEFKTKDAKIDSSCVSKNDCKRWLRRGSGNGDWRRDYITCFMVHCGIQLYVSHCVWIPVQAAIQHSDLRTRWLASRRCRSRHRWHGALSGYEALHCLGALSCRGALRCHGALSCRGALHNHGALHYHGALRIQDLVRILKETKALLEDTEPRQIVCNHN